MKKLILVLLALSFAGCASEPVCQVIDGKRVCREERPERPMREPRIGRD